MKHKKNNIQGHNFRGIHLKMSPQLLKIASKPFDAATKCTE